MTEPTGDEVMLGYRIEYEADDNGTWLVTCPALPEVTTFAGTEEEFGRVAVQAAEEALAGRMAAGQEVPLGEPVDGSKAFVIGAPGALTFRPAGSSTEPVTP